MLYYPNFFKESRNHMPLQRHATLKCSQCNTRYFLLALHLILSFVMMSRMPYLPMWFETQK